MEELQEQMQGAQKVAWADNAIKLAVESYRQRKTMVWDPKRERVVIT